MKTSTLVLVVILGIVLVLGGCVGCGAIGFQKRTVGLEENVRGQWGNVQTQYQRRADLIPNLVNTVKGEANFERGTLTDVINARARATSMQISPDNLTPENIQKFQQAQAQLSGALSRLLVVSEQYPNLRANDAFRNLQTQLEGTENRIAVARKDYNEAVQQYNTSIRTFPNNIYSGWFNFSQKGYFESDPGARNAPTVDFGTGNGSTAPGSSSAPAPGTSTAPAPGTSTTPQPQNK
ncbi:MAG: LemA family protein [Sphingobacteriales bacterium]|nr:MAG: LemA family protein [Sphingobacteriales bacterium]